MSNVPGVHNGIIPTSQSFPPQQDLPWRYRYLADQDLSNESQKNDWLSQTQKMNFMSMNEPNENNQNRVNQPINPWPRTALAAKGNGANAVTESLYRTQELQHNLKTVAEHFNEIEVIKRLDTFLKISTNKAWEKPVTASLPSPDLHEASGSRHAFIPIVPNYQYNPNSTVNRVKGCLTWDGYLPPRTTGDGDYQLEFSQKVFLGGVPWDVSEQHLHLVFSRYGEFKIEWPSNFSTKRNTTKSFLYLIFENLSSISALLADCSKEQHGGSVTYNYRLAQDKISKPIQVIPWHVADNVSVYQQQSRVSNKMTVFVGALHGRLYAQALGHIFQELFGNVAFVQIDTDRYKYPIGSGRVTFNSADSYKKAVEENFLTIIAPKFSKRIQIEPYIEDEPCGKCHVISAPNFCKSRLCFEYFCDNCWGWHHSIEGFRNHIPVKRNRKVERF